MIMAPRTAREARALRRSSRLESSNGSNESFKPPVQLSPRRTTGQLRLPSPTASTTKRGVKKRATAGRRSKSKGRANSSARNSTQSGEHPDPGNRDVSHDMPSPEPASIGTKDCIYCCPDSKFARCSHRRGQPPPESSSSFLGPNIVLPSVETDSEYNGVLRGEHLISREEERNDEEIVNMLAKKSGKESVHRCHQCC
jgi:hypothetical protein